MKNKRKMTKRLLQVDLGVQISLIILTVILMIAPNTEWSSFATFYFGLGGFQLFSYILHLPRRLKQRELSESYSYILAGVIVFGILGLLINEILFMFLVILLFLGVFMAIYYLIHTYTNLKAYQDEK